MKAKSKRKSLASEAISNATRLRLRHGFSLADAICPYEIARKENVNVVHMRAPSLEGMYNPGSNPTIVIGAQRPAGRRRLTCAHELGHHNFGHGRRIDDLVSAKAQLRNNDPDEYIADTFAAHLLMPKTATNAAFARRKFHITAQSIFIIAQDLGVGYTSLINQMHWGLGLISSSQATLLRKTSLPKLREIIAGFSIPKDLVVLDEHWGKRNADLEVGDMIRVPEGAQLIGAACVFTKPSFPFIECVQPGTSEIQFGSRLIKLNVSRRHFEGLDKYRFLPEVTDE